MEKKISLPIFMLIALFISFVFIKEASLIVLADTSNTQVVVTGGAPTIGTGPSDGGITSTNPVNVGGNVTFTATADDPNGDQYYLAICRTNAIATSSDAAPTCTGGAWCYSTATNDNTEATCATTTAAWMASANDWYAFACDKISGTGSQCSTMSQGTGNNGSPFHVNHAPTFTAVADTGPKNPGQSITFYTTSTDADSTYTADTVKLAVCKTTGVSGTECDGGFDDTYCTSSYSASDPSCSFTLETPSAHGATSTYVYIFDSHGFASDGVKHGAEEQYTVNDVAPTISSISLNGGSSINVSTGGEGTSGNVNIYSTSTVTDNNGCADVASVTTSAYTTDVGAGSCTSQNGNTCYYNVSCTAPGACSSGVAKDYVCTINFKYHAYPTDASSPKSGETWKNTIYASDGASTGSTELTTGVDLLSYTSIDVSASVNYGSLSVGNITNTTTLPQSLVVQATGNTGVDLEIGGSNMVSGGNNITVGYQKYATSAVQYSSATALTDSMVAWDLNVIKPTSTASLPASTTYWGLQIPSGTAAGTYSGTITSTAVVNSGTGLW